ncbi:MAG: choice-of-anchor D domain-containing protein [Bacteroidetes bacterium]|nr:MAG: choice-of-anchor D domain-containing protein [Bacteroidota bacterium]
MGCVMRLFTKFFSKKRYFYLKYLIILSTIAVWFSLTTYAHRAGITGLTSTTSGGCSCHSSGSNSAVTVSNTSGSGSYVFDPNSTNSFSVTVTHASQPACGVNIAVKTDQTGNTNAGTLNPGTGLQNIGGELTHTNAFMLSGGQVTVNFTWVSPSTPGIYYLRAISNAVNNNFSADPGDIWNWMTVQQLTVAGVTVSGPNGGESWCAGTTHNITWTSLGLTTVKIEISGNGGSSYSLLASGIPASSGSWSWDIPAGQTAGNQYRIRVTDESNPNRKDESNANFTIASGLSITAQPQSQTACTERSIQFSVTATGGGLSYQWRKSSANISGASSSVYTITSVKTTDAGVYDCVVSSACGSPVTSSPATLSVDITPSITTQPQSQTVCKGENVNFTVTAVGTDITYQWKKNGTNINGATATTYSISNVQTNDAAQYTVEVSGKCTPPKTSQPAILSVNTAPVISKEPDSLQVCIRKPAAFSVISSGLNNTYKWFKNDIEIPNSNAPTYSITAVSKNDEGNYHVIISNSCNPQTSSRIALLTVNEAPFILNQPEPLKVTVGANASFSITANSATGFQWRKNNNILTGKTSSTLNLTNVQLADSGNYDCIVSNSCGKDTSISVKLTVEPAGAGPLLTVSNSTIDFGTIVTENIKDTTISSLLKNTGTAKLDINAISIIGKDSASFSIVGNPAPFSLQQNETKNLTIRFAPVSGGNKSATIRFTSNTSKDTNIVLKGFGAVVSISLSNAELKFDTTNTNTNIQDSIKLNNSGNVNIEILQMDLTGNQKSYFSIVSPEAPFTIDSGSSKNVVVSFNPLTEGLATAQLNITIKNKIDKLQIGLSGIGIILGVNDDEDLVKDLIAYPNPTDNDVKIDLQGIKGGDFKVSIYNILGNEIRIFDNISINYKNIIQWDGTDNNGIKCGAGTYICLISNGVWKKFIHIVIMK